MKLLFNFVKLLCRFSIRGKVERNPTQRIGGCSFELEICYLPNLTPKVSSTPTKSILRNGPMTRNTTFTLVQNGTSDNFSEIAYFVGIRRKRLKGDSWCYKKVCEEVLALTATDLKPPPTESAV